VLICHISALSDDEPQDDKEIDQVWGERILPPPFSRAFFLALCYHQGRRTSEPFIKSCWRSSKGEPGIRRDDSPGGNEIFQEKQARGNCLNYKAGLSLGQGQAGAHFSCLRVATLTTLQTPNASVRKAAREEKQPTCACVCACARVWARPKLQNENRRAHVRIWASRRPFPSFPRLSQSLGGREKASANTAEQEFPSTFSHFQASPHSHLSSPERAKPK